MNDQISRQKLKPCPFCGGEAVISVDTDAITDTEGRVWAYTAVCNKCAASSGLTFTVEKAIEVWNKRTEPPADQWIPVTYHETTEEEREYGIEWDYVLDCPLPDNDTEILVCTKSGSVWTDTFFNDDGCYLDGGYDCTEIAAWMPLPEPYKGVE